MWQGNYGFNNGNPPPNNPNQNGHPVPPFTGSPGSEQQYSPMPQQFNQGPHGEGYIGFQPPTRHNNEQMFLHNQMTTSPMAQFPSFQPAQFNISQPLDPNIVAPTPMSARAAELKAQLLKGREHRGSQGASTKMGAQATKQQSSADQHNHSVQKSPNTPATSIEQEHNINELISQYSESNPAAAAQMKQGKAKVNPPHPAVQRPSTVQPLAMPQGLSSGSSVRLAELISDSSATNTVANTTLTAAQAYNAEASEMSEGEIRDEETPKESSPPLKPKESQASVPQIKARTRNPPTKQESATKPNNNRDLLRDSLPYRPPSCTPSVTPSRTPSRIVRPDPSSGVVASQAGLSSRQDKRAGADDKNNRGVRLDSDKQPHPQDRSQNHNKEIRIPVVTGEQNGTENIRPAREVRTPTLAQLLPHDRDLREWLEVTDYFNVPNRDKILKRRRAIAELDEQRRKLVAEMESDERGPILLAPRLQYSNSVLTATPYVKNEDVEAELAPVAKPAEPKPQHDRVVSNKRSYSDTIDTHAAGGGPVKLQRIDGRPMTSGHEFSRRESSSYRAENRSERPRYDDVRGRGRTPSPVRGRSPFWRRGDSRSPSPRLMRYDRLDESGYRGKERRPFEVRGGYRGRAYDPNYRRGRGSTRGRGDLHGHFDSRIDGGYGPRVVNGGPFKDPEGFERGRKGDTRYFIIKSFNEENVQRCIDDDIWTTQLQNGPILSEAFKTCKNVILVFSINKSRAFQGYARMESLPGSVEAPSWQKTINWETAGPFKVRWLVIYPIPFHRVGHLKNALNENQAVLVGKDGQEIEATCGTDLVQLMDEEAEEALMTLSDRGSVD